MNIERGRTVVWYRSGR